MNRDQERGGQAEGDPIGLKERQRGTLWASWSFVLGCLCIWVAGCHHDAYWYQRGKTVSEAERDCRDCFQEAQVLASETSWDQRLNSAAAPGEPDSGQWSYAFEDSQWRRCMKNAGYALIPERDLGQSIKKRTLHLGIVQTFPIAGE